MSAATAPLVVLVGPTAVGKTDLSLFLARTLAGEIVSADSRLFYRGMDIGTAKPSAAERAAVPHHLIDVAEPWETWSLVRFRSEALAAITSIHARGRLPLLVGGTGQYVRAVTHGWLPPAVAPQPRLRVALETMAAGRSPYWLHEKLRGLDPDAAAAIDPRNTRRVIRALEVVLLSGQRFSRLRGQADSPFRLVTIGLTEVKA